MQLCLMNNDPASTLLVTPEGEPVFSIETLPLPHTELGAPSSCSPKCMTTTVKRVERYQSNTGHVETSIGVIEFCGPTSGALILLCNENHQLHIDSLKRRKQITAPLPEKSQGEEEGEDLEKSWEFTGPDSRRYKWQMLARSPWLFLEDNGLKPLARYHCAKIGIVSRSRRALLEILPGGMAIIDLIIVTFVAFIKQRLLTEGPGLYDVCSVSSLAPTCMASSEPPDRKPGCELRFLGHLQSGEVSSRTAGDQSSNS
ncbi:hypothetical protein M413DRAFT_116054 [Hebeloma cylindrosporum]|uniref:DUF6593 domain-containing protein n=1 Tax=Hebeloma cylindrosporum TaxID=76867 RepID=A0A0C2Z9F9_HEBCY|nr:hypothetical protein M413DRAFT_116054 [Hebeloma cylindrosporum h7]